MVMSNFQNCESVCAMNETSSSRKGHSVKWLIIPLAIILCFAFWITRPFLPYPFAENEPSTDRYKSALDAFAVMVANKPDAFNTTPELAQTEDLDGDGFSNLEEWLFVYYGKSDSLNGVKDWSNPGNEDIALLTKMSAGLFSADAMPAFDPNSEEPSNPPFVSVTLEAKGEGSIAPFTNETRNFSKYALTDWYAWYESGIGGDAKDHCAVNTLSNLAAIPADDWVFENWDLQEGSLSDIVSNNKVEMGSGGSRGSTIVSKSFALPLKKNTRLEARFKHQPGLDNRDLVNAFKKFMVWTEKVESDEEILLFDRGDSIWDRSVHITTGGNGIPDIAEMMFLQHILDNPDATYPHIKGKEIVEEFYEKQEYVLPYLEGQDEEIVQVAAAYLTLDDADFIAWLHDDVGINIDTKGHKIRMRRYLSADGGIDGYNFTNLEQWWWVVENNQNLLPMCMELAEIYVKTALDSELPPYEWNAIPEGTEGEPCGVWNDEHIPTRKIAFGDDVEAYVIDPGGCAHQKITGTMEVHVGRRIHVKYVGKPGWFNQWSVPNTRIDGSGDPTDYFYLGPSHDDADSE